MICYENTFLKERLAVFSILQNATVHNLEVMVVEFDINGL
jgi:hypothetical protein